MNANEIIQIMSTNNSLIDSISILSSTFLLLLPLAITIERGRARKQYLHHQSNGNKSDISSTIDKEGTATAKKQNKLRHIYIPNIFTQKEMDDVSFPLHSILFLPDKYA